MAGKTADNRVIKYGRVWPNKPWGPKNRIIPCPDWYIELCILRDYERMKSLPGNKLVSWQQHFVNFTKIIFGDPRGIFYFEWNPNAMRILDNFYRHNILAIAGHKSCVPYETKLLDPTTGKEHEIGWLCENNIAPVVMTLEGPKQAEVPFLKGEAEIFEVTAANGNKIRCTSKHRFLTPSGWKRLEEMKVGDAINSYDAESLASSVTNIVSIKEDGFEKFYDLTVPGPAHYFAQGFISHNSGKTECLALIGALWFFLFPKDTKVIVTSTTVAAAKDKVWGKIKLIWIHLEKFFGPNVMPGKLVDSQNRIRYEFQGVKSETRGIVLLASESSSEKESADKLQGTKAERMIVMGDEFATLKHSLLNTVLNNLTANKQCKLAGAFNPNSYYDPGGIISRPKGGWSTVTEDDIEWETEIEPFGLKGYCIRFDGEKSPNVVLGEERWKGLLTLEKLQQIGPIGTKTKGYYEQIRGYWSPAGDLDSIYTETEIVKYGADRPVTTWVEPPVMVAALDPGFVHGGDRAALAIGKSGVAVNVDTQTRQKVFELTHIYVLDDDITNKTISKVEWVVKLTKEKLKEHGVDIRNFAIDATGGGEPFSALIARDIGMGFINVCFSGRASDMPVSRNDNRKGSERFFNMASELWYVGRELVRTGQLRGLKPDVVAELCARTYKEKANVVQIESKKDLKLRTKRSPDCFVAGTMVKTPNGEIPIESIQIGDFVDTPFGPQKVMFLHESITNRLTTIKTGNSSITGKGKHKVFVKNQGWHRLDSICNHMIIESVYDAPIWKLLHSLFTTVENTDFKHLENTIKIKTGMVLARKRDYFTELSGLSTTEIFLKICASITKTVIGGTMPSKTLPSCQYQNMRSFTGKSDTPIQREGQKWMPDSLRQEKPQKHGTLLQRAWHGIKSMLKHPSSIKSLSQKTASFAVKSSNQKAPAKFAVMPAGKSSIAKRIEFLKTAFAAARSLIVSVLIKQRLAVHHVEQKCLGRGVKVYNLTLERENVYYANGFLVQNCADSALMCLHVARVRHGLSSNEKAAVVIRPRKMAEFDLAFLTKKPTQSMLPDSRLISFGGGWAKQI